MFYISGESPTRYFVLQSPRIITLTLRSQDGSEFQVSVEDNARVRHIFHAYAAAKALDFNDLRFIHYGDLLSVEGTCREMEIESGDFIDVVFAQGGD